MIKVVHSLSYVSRSGEVNSGEIMTVPDQSLSIRSLLENYTRGLPLPQAKPVYFDENDIYPDVRSMDLVDIQEFGLNVINNFNDLRDEQFRRSVTKKKEESTDKSSVEEGDE